MLKSISLSCDNLYILFFALVLFTIILILILMKMGKIKDWFSPSNKTAEEKKKVEYFSAIAFFCFLFGILAVSSLPFDIDASPHQGLRHVYRACINIH